MAGTSEGDEGDELLYQELQQLLISNGPQATQPLAPPQPAPQPYALAQSQGFAPMPAPPLSLPVPELPVPVLYPEFQMPVPVMVPPSSLLPSDQEFVYAVNKAPPLNQVVGHQSVTQTLQVDWPQQAGTTQAAIEQKGIATNPDLSTLKLTGDPEGDRAQILHYVGHLSKLAERLSKECKAVSNFMARAKLCHSAVETGKCMYHQNGMCTYLHDVDAAYAFEACKLVVGFGNSPAWRHLVDKSEKFQQRMEKRMNTFQPGNVPGPARTGRPQLDFFGTGF